ncbi:BA75_02746T0 [Komagataella pastoris]|uniref:BA75_02746T0 n=1 Tax=Komagataella pastoris TaxID=4922 RepID=A0A1B2JE22_PICPA|nr:BA75_02746T0 [Komagataella pastoris]
MSQSASTSSRQSSLPQLTSSQASSTITSSASSSSNSESQNSTGSSSATSSGSSSGRPRLSSSTTSSGMPQLTTTSQTSSTSSFSTPAISVPPSNNNPFIWRSSQPSGTVFISIGAVMGLGIICFIVYITWKNLKFKRQAKTGGFYDSDDSYSHKYDTKYYGNDLTTTPSRVPFMAPDIRSTTDNTYYSSSNSEPGANAGAFDSMSTFHHKSKQPLDTTRMYVSPTADAIKHSRNSVLLPSVNNGKFGSDTSILSPSIKQSYQYKSPTGHHRSNSSQQLFMSPMLSSTSLVDSKIQQQQQSPSEKKSKRNAKRKTVPSMYLDQLMDGEGTDDLV